MQRIKFSHNWNNKLSPMQTIFTTIRKYSPDKFEYYKSLLGTQVEPLMTDRKDESLIIGVRYLLKVRAPLLSELPDELLMLDTGLPTRTAALEVFHRFGIEKDDRVLLITCGR